MKFLKAVGAFVVYFALFFIVFALIVPQNPSESLVGIGVLIIFVISIYIAIKAYKFNTMSLIKIFNLQKATNNFKPQNNKEDNKNAHQDNGLMQNASDISRRQKDKNPDIEIIYEDASGRVTQREVMVTNITNEYIKGWCYLRNDLRTFRIDRIKELVDLKTGEVISKDIENYLKDRFNFLRSDETKSKTAHQKEEKESTQTYTINFNLEKIIKEVSSPEYEAKRKKEIESAKNYINQHSNEWYADFDEFMFYNDNGKFIIPKYKISDCNLKLKIKDVSDRRGFWSVYDKEEKENFTIDDFNRDGDYVFEYEVSPDPLIDAINPELLIENGLCNTKNEAKAIIKLIKEFHDIDYDDYENLNFYIEKREKKNYENLNFVTLKLLETNEEKAEYFCMEYTKKELTELCDKHQVKCKKSGDKHSIALTLAENGLADNVYKVMINKEKLNDYIEAVSQVFIDELKNCIKDFHPYAKKAFFEAVLDSCAINKIGEKIEDEFKNIEKYCEQLNQTGYRLWKS